MAFPSDEGGAVITNITVPIPIKDDDIDESLEQYFIVRLEILNATTGAVIGLEVSDIQVLSN